MSFLAGVFVGVLVVVLGGVVVALTGTFDVAAITPPGKLEHGLAEFVLDRSVERRAPVLGNPRQPSPALLEEGLSHYRANCLPCHGAPGVESFEFGKGMNPPAPDLAEREIQARSDGELFWIIRNGIRMSGMPAFAPTHTDEEIWGVVAFLRHLPGLRPEERSVLSAAVEKEKHHHQEPSPDVRQEGHVHPPGTKPHGH